MFARNPYNYDTLEASDASGFYTPPGSSLTKQEFKEECDINQIALQYGLGYAVPVNVRAPVQLDFVQVTDYAAAMRELQAAQGSFLAMPARVREEFGNDPARFVAFCSDPANLERMRELGLTREPGAVIPPLPGAPGAQPPSTGIPSQVPASS